MLFNSLEFIIFLIIVFSLYYIPSKKLGKAYQVFLLLLSSAIFYGWENANLLIILFISCIGNTICCLYILHTRTTKEGDEKKKKWVITAVILNLLLLGFFKYSSFFASLIPFIPESCIAWLQEIPLPIGISFYTFHGISMIIDVAHGNVRTSEEKQLTSNNNITGFVKSLRDIGFYMLFFPQLIAGPIVRARQFWPQIEAKKFNDIQWGTAFRFLLIGYFLKMVLADNLSEYTPYLKDMYLLSTMNAATALSLMLGYSFQIFADFCGYSMIAVGLAILFGYRLPDNFNFPYISTSITEFWQRWNITLSQWLRDYLYIPLGGNRKGKIRTYINLFIVMFLGGLWHGAEWKFAIWGLFHGIFLAIERILWGKNKAKNIWLKITGGIYCFFTVSFLWMTFLMPDMNTLKMFFSRLLVWENMHISSIIAFAILVYGTPVIIYHIYGWIQERHQSLIHSLKHPLLEGIFYGIILYLILNNSGPSTEFIYFQF